MVFLTINPMMGDSSFSDSRASKLSCSNITHKLKPFFYVFYWFFYVTSMFSDSNIAGFDNVFLFDSDRSNKFLLHSSNWAWFLTISMNVANCLVRSCFTDISKTYRLLAIFFMTSTTLNWYLLYSSFFSYK